MKGICKTCGGIDTIFGTWSIIHPPKDCRDLQMTIETKRDIFRQESLHLKRLEKLEMLKNSKGGKTNSTNPVSVSTAAASRTATR